MVAPDLLNILAILSNTTVRRSEVVFDRTARAREMKISENQKQANLKTGVARKQSTPKFPKNDYFLCSFFGKFWRALFSCNTRLEIRPFVLLPMK